MPTAEMNAALSQKNMEDFTEKNEFDITRVENQMIEFDAWTRDIPSTECYAAMH